MITASGWCRCGHESAVHRFGKDGCVANICECAKFKQAGPPGNTGPPPIVFRPTGDFYEDDEPVEKIVAAFESGEKGVTGPPDLAHAIQDFFYPNVDGWRSCAGCGAIPGRGHAPIGHAPLISCPVEQLQAVLKEVKRLRAFERAIVDAFGELRWDKVSAALVALHAPDQEHADG